MAVTIQQARSLIRKAVKRVPQGESITHLNIMPMMDMMTILLVAFIGQMAADQIETPPDFVASDSSTQEPLPDKTTVLFVTKNEIVVGTGASQVSVVPIKDGKVNDPEHPPSQVTIKKLADFLVGWRAELDQKQKDAGKKPDKDPDIFLVADKDTPYGLLYSVMASAGPGTGDIKGGGYKKFRLITSSDQEISPPEQVK